MVETATIQQEQTVAEREIEERDALQKYKRLASDFDFGLKADEEYAKQLLSEHREYKIPAVSKQFVIRSS